MLGDALYYPHIDIQDGAWLRSAILFWNSIKTIAPTSVPRPYLTAESKILFEEGFLTPLRCDLHPELLDRLGKRVIALMDRRNGGMGRDEGADSWLNDLLNPADDIGHDMRRRFRQARIDPNKLSPDLRDFAMRAGLAWMHPAKLSPEVLLFLKDIADERFRRWPLGAHRHQFLGAEPDQDHQWLLLNGDFASVYMSTLASTLAKEGDLSLLTTEIGSSSINSRFILDDIAGPKQSEKFAAFVSLFMENIVIDQNVKIQDVLVFRRSREHQLAELSAQFEELSLKIPNCEDVRELEDQVRRIYATRIRPKLEALKGELRDASIHSVWQGFHRAVTIAVPAGGALAYFTGYGGIELLGAGVAVAVADVAVMSHFAQKKARRASPYSYLLDVEREFQVIRNHN